MPLHRIPKSQDIMVTRKTAALIFTNVASRTSVDADELFEAKTQNPLSLPTIRLLNQKPTKPLSNTCIDMVVE